MSRETVKQQNPAEMSVEQKLKTLYELQTVLSKIDEIRTMRGELPLEVQDMEDELEGLSNRVVKLQEDVKVINASISKWNEEKIAAQSSIEKNTAHLDNVRNSREYDALSKEIEFQNLEIQLRDKKIHEATESKEERLSAISDSQQQEKELTSSLEAKKNELDEIVKETKAQEDELREKSKNLEEKIEPRLLTAFKRIRKNSHNGLGIVYVQRDACGGCFNKIPPQRQLDVRMRKKIIVCEYCGRIMIDPELAGVETVKPVEEPKKTRRRRVATKE
jgi:predicted  nucleic acid-binding Zn-ribbon protein